jgi:glycosyltransferase involved in cell wall biosynthesis
MKKSILVDFEKMKDPFSGLGQFCLYLKNCFEKRQSDNLDIVYYIPENRKIVKLFPFLLPSSDVFHSIHQDSPYLPFFKKIKYVLTIHDLNAIYEAKSEHLKNRFIKKLQKKINRADIITFISEFTKSETIKYFDLKNKKTIVIYNGISLPENSNSPRLKPQKKFLFSIGTVLPKKNFHVLIDMMKFLPEYELIIAGTTFHKYANEMKDKIKSNRQENQIHLIGTITNEEKKWYYENAEAFLFPSLFEGFGLPVTEAMSLGLPLFLSSLTSLPEIGGSDAFYFENFEPLSMANFFKSKMQQFNSTQKMRLIERSKKFSWEKASEEYLGIYKSL